MYVCLKGKHNFNEAKQTEKKIYILLGRPSKIYQFLILLEVKIVREPF